MRPEDLELEPSRVRLEDALNPELAPPLRPRKLWRGQTQQSVLMLQVMGQMWDTWERQKLCWDV